ncbi:thiol:disulfide interchange protein DsbA [Dinoroseobacter shibae DFL 12 = DSM 16493]|uniref:Thiol:disulfide interchange protein DsbA n=2 Tax=Dinoroseobacter shibae TaxID=215813 RepID=A8LP73_DINSH|nr:thiol:disulfide interchange protein DsbA [Dinoroseobacter shibae DFL 12 = DSM 16493]
MKGPATWSELETEMKHWVYVAAIGASLASPVAAQELSEERIKELALEAILENPQIVMDAVAILREREAEAQVASAAETLANQRDLLERDENAPVLGNPDGDVTVIEFFDYNCPYCRRAKPTIEGLIAADPNVRVVFREFPILGDDSVLAARAALAARAQGMYEEFHWALMALSGRINEAQIMQTADDLGLDVAQLEADMQSDAVTMHIETSLSLAQSLGISGTPSFVVGETILPGLVDQARLEELVAQERSDG